MLSISSPGMDVISGKSFLNTLVRCTLLSTLLSYSFSKLVSNTVVMQLLFYSTFSTFLVIHTIAVFQEHFGSQQNKDIFSKQLTVFSHLEHLVKFLQLFCLQFILSWPLLKYSGQFIISTHGEIASDSFDFYLSKIFKTLPLEEIKSQIFI